MGELYDKSIFNKRDEAAQQRENSSNRRFIIFVVLAVLAVAGIFAWRWWDARQPVNVNTASFERLQSLPEVGPAIAQDIMDKRPFATPEDLKRVKGIGDKTFEKMRPRVTVE